MLIVFFFLKILLAPPALELDFRDKLTVRVGEAFSLTGRYSGKPQPKVTWLKDDITVKEDKRTKIQTTPVTLCLGLLKSTREDSGKYCVVIENSSGSRKGLCQVTVVGKYCYSNVMFSLYWYGQMVVDQCVTDCFI